MRLYQVEVAQWGTDGQPESFEIIRSIPFAEDGAASAIYDRGYPTNWSAISGHFFHPCRLDAEDLGITVHDLLLRED